MSERGFLLAEASIAYLILALSVAALIPAFLMSVKANKAAEKRQIARDLTTELLEEVRLRKWDENTTLPTSYTATYSTTLGADAGETATDKTTFDDVDDFNGYTETGVKDPLGVAVAGFERYIRTVTVSYVDPSSLATTASVTDLKQVTVCTTPMGLPATCQSTLLTNR